MKKRQDKRLREKEAKESNKKAQMMQLPFGMIFSILLIALFIVVAFIAIRHFINLKKCGQVNIFIDELQKRVDTAWQQQEDYGSFSSTLPSGIEYVCFADLGKSVMGKDEEILMQLRGSIKDNLFFYPAKDSCNRPSANIQHVNTTEIIRQKNPYCFENKEKVSMSIEKGFYDNFVKIK